jgi:hypothetical protein
MEPARLRARPDRDEFLAASGVNLPWISYGHDVGWILEPGRAKRMGFWFFRPLIPDRARLPDQMGMIRLWMMGDDRLGFMGPEAHPGFTDRCVRDMAAFMDAIPERVAVMWTLYDFGIADGSGSRRGGIHGEHRDVLASERGWKLAWERIGPCLAEIQSRYEGRVVFDIINEPLNGRRMVITDRDLENLIGFVRTHMVELLELGARVSLGVRSLGSVRATWKGLLSEMGKRVAEIGLPPDHLVVQFHHYPGKELHPESSLLTFTAAKLRSELDLHPETPVLLGECWPDSGFTLSDYYAMGFSGALFWQDAKLRLPWKMIEDQIAELEKSRPDPWEAIEPVISTREGGKETESTKQRAAPDAGAGGSSVEIPLDGCELVQVSSPRDRQWHLRLKAAARGFSGLALGKDGKLTISMDVDAMHWSARRPYWEQKKRKGGVICPLPTGVGPDLRGKEITVSLVPPVEAVAHRWGSGAQVVLQDAAGRRLHGPWTGLSKLTGGMRHVMRFRPAENAVPGMGFRHTGFDLKRVRHVGFQWAVSTFSRVEFKAEMKMEPIRIGPGEGRLRLYDTGSPRVRVPLATELSGCRFVETSYPYYLGLAPLRVSPALPELERRPATSRRTVIQLQMSPASRFHKAGAIKTDLVAGCSADEVGRGALFDLRGFSVRARVAPTPESKPPKAAPEKDQPSSLPVGMQLFVRDLRGAKCYSAATAKVGETLVVRLVDGVRACAAGKGVDLSKVARIGLTFFLHRKAKKPVNVPVELETLELIPPTRTRGSFADR